MTSQTVAALMAALMAAERELTRTAASSRRVQIGGYCIKGGGHLWTLDEGSDGCSGWEVFIEIDPEDLHLFPDWIKEAYRDRKDPVAAPVFYKVLGANQQ